MTSPAVRPSRWALAALPVASLATLGAIAVSGAAAPTVLGDAGALVRWLGPVLNTLNHLVAAAVLGGLVLLLGVLPPPAAVRDTRQARRDSASAGAGKGGGAGGRREAAGDEPDPGDPVRPDAAAREALPERSQEPAEDDPGRAWTLTATIVAWLGPIWAVVNLGDVLFKYASTAGRPVGGDGFGDELIFYLTEIAGGRLGLTATILIAFAAVLCVATTGYRSAVLAAIPAFAVLLPWAATGHAAGGTDHELAMSAMWLHLLGAALWVGGLVVLCLVAKAAGTALADTARRYSAIALWCFVLVGVSGLASGWLRINTPADLLGPYGTLLITKMVLFTVLGAFGWWHRSRSIPAIRASPGVFWRFAAVEVLVMGAVFGVAGALGTTEPPRGPDAAAPTSAAEVISERPVPPEPSALNWLTQVAPDLVFAVGVVALAGLYLAGVVRLRRRGDRWPLGRAVVFLAGVLVLAWVLLGGPAVYGRLMFSAHMVAHMTLAMVIPIALVLGAPMTLALRALPRRRDGSRGPREWLLLLLHAKVPRFLAHPVVAAVNFAGSMVVFYFTPLFLVAMTTHLGHVLMVVHFLIVGYLFINALIGIDPGPSRPGYPLRLLLLFATMAFHAFFGVALMALTTLLAADYFGALGLPWGVDALADQADGGAITWGIGEIPAISIAIALVVSWARDDTREAKRQDRAAARDDDAELKAYNAMLEKLPRE